VMLLVSGATKTMRRISDPRLGVLLRPGNGNMPDGRPWACDNGAFTGFDEKAFVRLLERLQGKPGCLWVAAPDVVGDHAATLELFQTWEPRIRAMGFPVAFVAQDGLTRDPPWDRFDCFFIGGSTAYKLSTEAALLACEAKRRGKLVHVGRVNSLERMQYANDIGADSVDGTSFSRFGDRWIPWALARMPGLEQNGSLWPLFRRAP
jgi:hypothetical protein